MNREMTFLQFSSRLQDDVNRFKVHVYKMMREKPGLFDDSMSHREWMSAFVRFLKIENPKRPRSSTVTRVR